MDNGENNENLKMEGTSKDTKECFFLNKKFCKRETTSKYETNVFAKGNGMPIKVHTDSELTTKDIYYTLWRCRDFELSHLWQRSIFLSAFLLLCFTGYGVLILKIAEASEYSLNLHILGGILGVVAGVFSCMWIMMAKGSKAWYEKYEKDILAFENSHYIEENAKKIITENHKRKDLDLNNRLYSTKGGEYSPSRINIGIGIVSLAIWIIAFIFHLFMIISNFTPNKCWPWYVLAVLIIIGIIAYFFLKKLFHSDTLSKSNLNKKQNQD